MPSERFGHGLPRELVKPSAWSAASISASDLPLRESSCTRTTSAESCRLQPPRGAAALGGSCFARFSSTPKRLRSASPLRPCSAGSFASAAHLRPSRCTPSRIAASSSAVNGTTVAALVSSSSSTAGGGTGIRPPARNFLGGGGGGGFCAPSSSELSTSAAGGGGGGGGLDDMGAGQRQETQGVGRAKARDHRESGGAQRPRSPRVVFAAAGLSSRGSSWVRRDARQGKTASALCKR